MNILFLHALFGVQQVNIRSRRRGRGRRRKRRRRKRRRRRKKRTRRRREIERISLARKALEQVSRKAQSTGFH